MSARPTQYQKLSLQLDAENKKLKDVIGYIYMNDKEALEGVEYSKNETLKTFALSTIIIDHQLTILRRFQFREKSYINNNSLLFLFPLFLEYS